jgi:hypothetical protein
MHTHIMHASDLQFSESGYRMWKKSDKYTKQYKNAKLENEILSFAHKILKRNRNSTIYFIISLCDILEH